MRPPKAHEVAPHQRLGPVHQAVRHDVQRHLELPGGDGVFFLIGDVGLERAEGQAVEQDAPPSFSRFRPDAPRFDPERSRALRGPPRSR